MNETERSRLLSLPIMVLVILSTMSAVVVQDSFYAAGFDDYGASTNINIALGHSWTYTTSYPSDISPYVTMTIQAYGTLYITIWIGLASHRPV